MNKQLKVLFTTNIPVPYRIDFFNELGKLVDLTVVFERKKAHTRNQDWLGTEFRNFKGIFMNGYDIGDDLAFCPAIVNVVRKGNFDCIIVGIYYSPTGILLTEYLRLTKRPFIMIGDGGFVKKDNLLKHSIKKHLHSGAEMYLITSEQSKQILVNYGISKKKIRKYPFTSLHERDIADAPASMKEKERLRQELGISEKRIILGVGRLLWGKGWQDLFSLLSLKENKEIGVYIVGGKPKGTDYEQCMDSLPANFHFIDFKQKAELRKFYRASDVFVLPSRHDVWGLVINEAMAMGLPVISTYTTVAATELIQSGVNGFLYKAGDVERLNELLIELFSDPNIGDNMGLNNIEKIRNYTIKNMALECYKHLEEML